jgi:DNA-directed RNA polymerase specialized sigma24 family protein
MPKRLANSKGVEANLVAPDRTREAFPMSATMHEDMFDCLPHINGLARRPTRDRPVADDLVQTAVMRALAHAHQY